MPEGNWTGESVYQTWVATLRRWSKDPTTSLAALPFLDETSFSPNTYELWFKHLNAAIQAVTDRWSHKLQQVWDENPDDFTLGKRLIELRRQLRYRVDLCSHPALPEEIRTRLESQTRADIERFQQELEDSVRRLPERIGASRARTDELLGIVREHSLVGLLTPHAAVPEPESQRRSRWPGGSKKQAPQPPATRRRTRIIDPSNFSN